jgi:hypothetical protein
MLNNKKSLIKMWAALSVALTATTEAHAAGLVVIADATNITGLNDAVKTILSIITLIGFIMGVVAVISGFRAINRGEEGKLQIAGGIGTALAVPIMKYVYTLIVPLEPLIKDPSLKTSPHRIKKWERAEGRKGLRQQSGG